MHVHHFDGKAEIERYIRDSGVPATFVMAGTFASEMHRLINWHGDKYVLALPVDGNAEIPLIDIRRDYGQSPSKLDRVHLITCSTRLNYCTQDYSSKLPSKTAPPC